ncbi:hypothetical protein GOBAR_AA30051 [Gossypium barbadense]|uniref:PHD-type domain-containing protein n=1 Tax=Gossypium barbadense TaxID=3634 RepID=A0A2P5WHS0_GOSBA|nr:hypothetical protein GOBAR_AA30051 [Gossypium barbadense]
MSFSADTEDLHDDGFEGSHDEHGIFTKVFFENGGGSTSKRCPIAGVDNFECEHSKKLDTSLCSNSANSAVTSWSCSKNLCQEDTNAVIESYGGVCASGSFLGRNALAERDDRDASVKRIKFSAAEVSRDKVERRMVLYAPLQQNEIVSGLYSKPLGSVYQKVTPDLIESSAQGFTSSGHLLKQYVKGGRGTKTKDKDITKSRIQDLDANDRKEAVIGKAIASPVSQESFASKLVVSSPAAVVEKFESPFRVEEQLSGFQSSGVGSSDISGVIDSKKDPRPLLQTHVFRILRSAGWSIERRKRSCRTYVETVYRSPEGRLFREFPNVWRYFGQVLFSDSCNFVLDNDGKKWTDMSQFWSDLLDTLTKIEKEVNQPNVSYTLAQYWAILDPFVNVIFVNRKIGSLRKGAEVKAGSSLAAQINKKNGVVLARGKNVTKEKFCSQGHMSTQLCDSSLAAESSLTASERSYNTCNGLSGNGSLSRAVRRLKGVCVPQADQVSMCLEDTANRPETFDCKVKGQRIASSYACGSDSTHGQVGNFKYNDCVTSGDVSDILQGSVSAALYQYSNISSPSSNKQRSECNVKTPSELPGDLSFESLEENDKSSGAQETGKVGKLPQHLLDDHSSYLSDGLLQSGCDEYQFDKLTNALKFETKDEGSALGVILKKKACRRSRKISEIRLTALNQSGFLWSYPPARGKNVTKEKFCSQGHMSTQLCDSSLAAESSLTASERSYNTCNGLSGNGSLSRAVRRLKGVCVPQADQVSMCLEDTANRPETFDCKVKGQRIASSYACGSDSTHGQVGNFKYNDCVTSGDVSDILQGSVSAALYQYSNISSPSSNKQRSECNVKTPSELPGDLSFESLEENDKSSGAQETGKVGKLPQHLLDDHSSYLSDGLLQSGCDEYQFDKLTNALKFETKDEGSALGVILKKKACRRSRKISEIRLTALNQSGFLWSYPPGMNEHRDTDVYRAELNSKEAQEYFVTKGNLQKSSSLGSCLHQVKKKGSKFKRSFGTCDGSKNRQKKSTECQIQDDDLLVSAIIRNKDLGLGATKSKLKDPKKRPRTKFKSKKSRCKLLPRSIGKGGKHITEIKLYNIGSRTVLSWLILAGVISLNDVIQYRDPEDDSIVKDGLVSWDGIVCNCCNRVLSVSEFKTHAGFKFNRPCMNLFMESGKPFTLCQLQAWSAEYKTRKNGIQKVEADDNDQNDDSCGLCGDVGELICCDNCPSTFHLSCLFMKELPEGNWYCSNCTCPICGNFVNDKDASSSFDSFKCSQCEHKYHKACLNDKSELEEKVSDTLFCGGSCKELHLGLSSRLGMINHLSNGFSWTLLRCIHEDQKIHSAQRLALKAECNSKLAVALSIMEECFLSMVDPRTGVDMRPHLMYNWGSEFARLNFSGFYSLVLEKEDVVICVASIRIHGVTVAEMPLIATCSKYRRQGMCRSLVNVIEELLISFKVEKLVITAIPNVVETWTKGFGFKLVEEEERKALNKINLMVFPGTVLLSKSLYQSQKTGGQSETGNTSCLQQDNSIEHLRREELTNIGIQAVGDQLANSLQHTIYAKETCAKIVTEFVGDKTLQDSEINGTKEIANASGEELCDNLALRVIEETTRLVICTKGKPADESVQCADCNFLSEEVRIKLGERPKVRSCQESPAGETNSVSQTDGCCGDNEADTVMKVESVQQSDPVCVDNHSAKIDEGVVVTPEQFLEVSCEEQEMALASSSVKESCIFNGTQVSVGETAAERL